MMGLLSLMRVGPAGAVGVKPYFGGIWLGSGECKGRKRVDSSGMMCVLNGKVVLRRRSGDGRVKSEGIDVRSTLGVGAGVG